MLHQIFRCEQRIIRPQESQKHPSLLFPALVVEFFLFLLFEIRTVRRFIATELESIDSPIMLCEPCLTGMKGYHIRNTSEGITFFPKTFHQNEPFHLNSSRNYRIFRTNGKRSFSISREWLILIPWSAIRPLHFGECGLAWRSWPKISKIS